MVMLMTKFQLQLKDTDKVSHRGSYGGALICISLTHTRIGLHGVRT